MRNHFTVLISFDNNPPIIIPTHYIIVAFGILSTTKRHLSAFIKLYNYYYWFLLLAKISWFPTPTSSFIAFLLCLWVDLNDTGHIELKWIVCKYNYLVRSSKLFSHDDMTIARLSQRWKTTVYLNQSAFLHVILEKLKEIIANETLLYYNRICRRIINYS